MSDHDITNSSGDIGDIGDIGDERFDELMRDASHTYRVPPEAPLQSMWSAIEREHFGPPVRASRGGLHARWLRNVAGIAAALVLGLGIGRYVIPARQQVDPGLASGLASSKLADTDSFMTVEGPYGAATTRYLGQTAALLISLPRAATETSADERLMSQASELLITTRLLLDSPAAKDPQIRSLLDDLELVLAQIARLPSKQRGSELDLIKETLQQRDVVPRLRSAVADISSSDN